MKVLVVQAHPTTDSFNAALLDAVTDGLDSAGHDVSAIRLYQDDFEARMSRSERIAYKTDSPIVSRQVSEHVAILEEAEALVFVYPTWFFGLPALLKGWLERVMLPGVAFVFDEAGRVGPGLANVRRIIGVTTYGSSWLSTRMVTDGGRRTITRTLRLVCKRRVRSTWLPLYAIDTSTPVTRERFVEKVRTTMAGL